MLARLKQDEDLPSFVQILSARQADQVGSLLRKGLPDESKLILVDSVPLQTGGPSISTWLVEYDVGKYLHAVLLPDGFTSKEVDDLQSTKEVDEDEFEAIRKYIEQVASRCRSLEGYSSGTTLNIVGGLGRGCVVPLPESRGDWSVSVIRVADLSMLVDEGDTAIERYLKCLAQRRLAESYGVTFQAWDDYGFYCYWLESDCRTVPLELSFESGNVVYLLSDYVASVREKTRRLLDRHAVARTDGTWSTVLRLTAAHYLPYMRWRPIYGSVEDAEVGALRGVVETDVGACWLTVAWNRGGDDSTFWLYELWATFIELFERLVVAMELRVPEWRRRPIEVRLDFGDAPTPSALGRPVSADGLVSATTDVDGDRRVKW